MTVPKGKNRKKTQRNQKIYQTHRYRTEWHEQAGKINLRNQIRINQNTLADLPESIRKKVPDSDSSQYHQRIGNTDVAFEPGDFAKNKHHYNHGRQRSYHAPSRAEQRLFVANR